jgi:hypothetical protein
VTGVLSEIGQDLPAMTIRPQVQGIPAFLLSRLSRLPGNDVTAVSALLSSIKTGDEAFDNSFQVFGESEASVRTFLASSLRLQLLMNRELTYELRGPYAMIHTGRLVFGETLDELVEAAEGLRRADFLNGASS